MCQVSHVRMHTQHTHTHRSRTIFNTVYQKRTKCTHMVNNRAILKVICSARERLLINEIFIKTVRNEHELTHTHTHSSNNKAHHLKTNIFWMHYLLHTANDPIERKKNTLNIMEAIATATAEAINSSTPTCIQWISEITKRFNS